MFGETGVMLYCSSDQLILNISYIILHPYIFHKCIKLHGLTTSCVFFVQSLVKILSVFEFSRLFIKIPSFSSVSLKMLDTRFNLCLCLLSKASLTLCFEIDRLSIEVAVIIKQREISRISQWQRIKRVEFLSKFRRCFT